MTLWAALVIVLLLCLFSGAAWWIRRLAGPVSPGAGVDVVGFRRLDAAHALWIVEVDGRRLLLGSGRDGVRLVRDLTPD